MPPEGGERRKELTETLKKRVSESKELTTFRG
jgi:hypothetical protein